MEENIRINGIGIKDAVLHPMHGIVGTAIGIFIDRQNQVQIEVEYKNSAGEVCSRWFTAGELASAGPA